MRTLRSAGVTTDDRRIVELLGEGGQLTAIAFADGTRLERDGLLVEAPLRQRSSLAEQLGVEYTVGPVGVDEITVDPMHRTTVDEGVRGGRQQHHAPAPGRHDRRRIQDRDGDGAEPAGRRVRPAYPTY